MGRPRKSISEICDNSLVKRVKKYGCNDSFKEITKRHEKLFYRICQNYMSILESKGIKREDVISEVSFVIFKAVKSYKFSGAKGAKLLNMETNIVGKIDHPGVPVLYDIQQTEANFVLIKGENAWYGSLNAAFVPGSARFQPRDHGPCFDERVMVEDQRCSLHCFHQAIEALLRVAQE